MTTSAKEIIRLRRLAQASCDGFNGRFKPGDQVRVWTGRRGGPGRTVTIAEPGAYVQGGTTPVVPIADGGVVTMSTIDTAAEPLED